MVACRVHSLELLELLKCASTPAPAAALDSGPMQVSMPADKASLLSDVSIGWGS